MTSLANNTLGRSALLCDRKGVTASLPVNYWLDLGSNVAGGSSSLSNENINLYSLFA